MVSDDLTKLLIILAVSFGFKSVDDYYSNSCSSDSIKHVRIPLLCIQVNSLPLLVVHTNEGMRRKKNQMLDF